MSQTVSSYPEKLKDPRWQKKRLQIFERDGWTCQACFGCEDTLAVHHRVYLQGADPWDYPDELLITLCKECHEVERVNRATCESSILDILRRLFFSESVHELMIGFRRLQPLFSPEVVASAYSWALSSPEVQKELVERFLADTRTACRSGAAPDNNPATRVM